MANVYVFRTGSIKHFSTKNIFLGWLNFPLSKDGIKKANIISKKLKSVNFDYAFCSDQIRGKQALVEVLKNNKKTKVIIDHRLRERNYGVFTGLEKDLIKHYFEDKFHNIHRHHFSTIPHGENFSDLEKRIYPFLNELLVFLQSNKESNILICAHTNSMRIIQAFFEDVNQSNIFKLENSPIEYKKYKLNLG
ncbi:MAG: histidine phosphatase family protein [Candidatus ainarchaeum sp.]|nr:histidine phosphatase family protein [Candidatus ainarchaeum sp.]